jgi:exosortase A
MTTILTIEAAAVRDTVWRRHLAALGIAWATILILFRHDAAHIASIWWNSSTYNHCLLIPPIILWLIWQRRGELARLEPDAWAPGLLLVGAGAAAWLVGDAGGLAIARHGGLVLMLQGAVIACLGKAVSRGLAFPISYALFMIPAGDEIVPAMQHVTAEICMFLLGLVGIPAHLEGIFITTPDGYFEVAEACAGVKFLVAMVAYGALVANVCFRSWPRRIAFMAAAVIIPILANGLRAFGTVYIAHLTSIEFAIGFDHVVYGGIFFAIVIALMMAAGWPFFDRMPTDPWFDSAAIPAEPKGRLRPVAAAALALAALPLVWSTAIAASGEAAPAELPLPHVPGWERVAEPQGRPWLPNYTGADLFRIARYRNAAGAEVDLAVAVFARQERGRELVAFGQGAVPPDGSWAWISSAPAPPGGKAERIGSHGTVREVLTFYRVGRILTGSGVKVKLEGLKTRLLGGPQRAVAVLVSTEAPGTGLSARPALDAFVASLGSVEQLADRAAGL